MTRRCLGCKYETGIVDYQIGHNATCRKRIMELMKEDPEDKHLVEYWELIKRDQRARKGPVFQRTTTIPRRKRVRWEKRKPPVLAHRPAVHNRIRTRILLFNQAVQAWKTEHQTFNGCRRGEPHEGWPKTSSRLARRDHPSNANEIYE